MIVSLSKKIKYYRTVSHDILDTENFYKLFIDLYNNFLFDPTFRFHFEHPTYLYLKYRLESVKNLFPCSKVLFHLFNCPRSNYAVSNCN